MTKLAVLSYNNNEKTLWAGFIAVRKDGKKMKKSGKSGWRTVAVLLSVLAGISVAFFVLYHTERRLRELCHELEMRMRVTPKPMTIELEKDV